MTPTLTRPREARALLDFARPSAVRHGFGWLDDDGSVDPSRPVMLWITGRMTHAFAMGHLLGIPGCRHLAAHGIAALATGLRDPDHPGWFSAVTLEGEPVEGPKVSYDHSFVILAASSGIAVGASRAADLLSDALAVTEELWWDKEFGMVVDAVSREGDVVDPYRGANANMHTVEAFLAAAAATGDDLWLRRALRITERMAGEFSTHGLRLPEHYDAEWRPQLNYNREQSADPFRPYGATPGHSFEWARLMVHLAAELEHRGHAVPSTLRELPQKMYDRAVADAWAPDGAPGFVYTTGFDGAPVVSNRMHWVLCEAIGAAAVLRESADGDRAAQLESDIARYWDFADRYLIECPGAWRHELTPDNSPVSGTWSGKPDIYHALQACLIGGLPSRPPFAWALKAAAEGAGEAAERSGEDAERSG
ncbi:MAG TPA: AGE family epimerase/isomerase [Actinomycetaceae bacterium]|nr:AGE family epimerase/isomerase [Actinomycetaceae bacterium]